MAALSFYGEHARRAVPDFIRSAQYLDVFPPPHAVAIPATIDGLPVVGVSLEAFYNCTNLTAVTLADSITYIGDYAFYGCSSLTRLTIPNSVNIIGNSAFESCGSLTYLILGTNLATVGQTAFRNCYKLASVTIPSSVTLLNLLSFDCGPQLTKAYFEGDPPDVDTIDGSFVFGIRTTNTTVYYLPGTTGWTNTFPGLPTALWRPQVETSDPSFGFTSNQFGFNISWARGRTVVVEATTNGAAPTWNSVGTNTLTDSSSYFRDLGWTNYTGRFYRVLSP